MTAYNWAPYQAATHCSGGPKPGPTAMDVFLEDQFPSTWHGNIYSCRDIVGGSSRSHHAEGRANDRMVPQNKPPSGVSVGYQIVKALGPHGKALGIDHIITNLAPWQSGRGKPMIYAAAYPQGKVYTGEHPHKDHDHIGFTRIAAEKLNLATIRKIVLGNEGGIDMADYKEIAGFKFYDYRTWSSWAVPSIVEAIESGVIHGKTFNENPVDRLYDPSGPVTREEIAVMFKRAGVLK